MVPAKEDRPVTPASRRIIWNYVRGLFFPVLLWSICIGYLFSLYGSGSGTSEKDDEAAMREWIREARITKTLPVLVRDYIKWVRQGKEDDDDAWKDQFKALLKTLGEPTKKYPGQLPFFPVIYRIQLEFLERDKSFPRYIIWDSDVPRHPTQFRTLRDYHLHDKVLVTIEYQLHAYNTRQSDEQKAAQRLRWVTGLAAAATALAFLWIYLVQRREQQRERQRALAQQQISEAERLLLMEELRRQEAEHRQEESERKLLEQRLATQESEQQLLELKSQLFASIGIMAGSYAHNIKNLLVRPNDLLRRCLEADSLSRDQQQMLGEVRQTLGMVTERLQQILHTVHRDPSRAELMRIDLNTLAREMQRTWEHLAREKWKLTLSADLWAEPLMIEGDLSHLQQAAENLLFNARDATFEMRSHLRDKARQLPESGQGRDGLEERRQALIAAAAWKGQVILRTRRQDDRAILEVQDNGIGMSEEVRRRCTETHFSTKRNNAIYEGYNSGMGLGLSFVLVVLQHQGASLDIESEPLRGTTFRISFPLAAASSAQIINTTAGRNA
jgi:signal transduction histidine kinase